MTFSLDYHSKVWLKRFSKYKNIFNSTVDRPPVISGGFDLEFIPGTPIAADIKYLDYKDIKAISSQPAPA